MTFEIQNYIRPGKRCHLVGVGGVSMCPLAEVLHGAGVVVTGSDMSESANVQHLRSLGIRVTIGHLPESVQGADCVIRTAAVHDSNPEIAAALSAGIPVFERAQAWGALMRHYENALCVSGTHGKTTTTSMCTHIFLAAQRDPSVMIGGVLPALGCGHRVGRGDTIILESCEYCNSFLSFFPTVAVILNVEADHLDFFSGLEDVKKSFRAFADLVPARGHVVANLDNINTMDTLKGYTGSTFTYSVHNKLAHCYADNIVFEKGLPSFDVVVMGQVYAHVSLQVGGEHNISNALAAAGAAYVLNVPGEAVAAGLGSFVGAGRRFEHKGEYNGAAVYDDYAHHPDELHALLTTAKTLGYKRVIAAFQPHTYTRTAALFDDFVRELKLADVTILAEIYAAREQNTENLSSASLAEQIPNAIFCPTLDDVTETFKKLARPGDLLLTVGAGDIFKAGEALVK